MSLPYFFTEQVIPGNTFVGLEEDSSRHIAQALRMNAGELLLLTDGKGNVYTGEITELHKKCTTVKILSALFYPEPVPKVAIGISLIKNAVRFEWFLEKATEIGVNEIIPLICDRTERQHFRQQRMKNILVSAMQQSQQVWLPELFEPKPLAANLPAFNYPQKFIAHCGEGYKTSVKDSGKGNKDVFILIGPEGDFSQQEIALALAHNFQPITLGENRLRTETAGIVAACLFKGF